MAERYPLVEQREYGLAQQRGGWLRKRTSRADGELPPLAAHQVRVFRVGEEYVEDHGRLRPDDGVVVAASSVTVVDRRASVPVVVEMRIPSAEVGDFTLRTTFHCTVTDASAVVRDGVTDVEALLFGYLRGIPGLAEEGGDLRIVDSATVRRRVDARLAAYLDMRPPVVSGLKAVPSAVDVLTPEELAAHLKEVEEARLAREKERLRDEMEQERVRAEADKERLREEIRREEALMKELNRQERERMRTTYERTDSAEGQEHALGLEAQRNGFVRNQITEDLRVIGNDPIAADFYANRSGDLTAGAFAERRREDESGRLEREDALRKLEQEYLERRATLEREDQERRAALDRDERRYRLDRGDRIRELTRQDRNEEAAAKREEQARSRAEAREDRLRERLEGRQDAQLLREEQRKWAERRIDLGKHLVNRGLVDNAAVDMGAFINSVSEIPPYGPAQALGQGRDEEVQKASAERLDKQTRRPAPTDVVDGDGDDGDDSDIGVSEANLGD
ncbi:hypothetical protein ACWKT5_42085 [Streptomyces avermitilis]